MSLPQEVVLAPELKDFQHGKSFSDSLAILYQSVDYFHLDDDDVFFLSRAWGIMRLA